MISVSFDFFWDLQVQFENWKKKKILLHSSGIGGWEGGDKKSEVARNRKRKEGTKWVPLFSLSAYQNEWFFGRAKKNDVIIIKQYTLWKRQLVA